MECTCHKRIVFRSVAEYNKLYQAECIVAKTAENENSKFAATIIEGDVTLSPTFADLYGNYKTDEYGFKYITDENGVETVFEYLDCIEYQGKEYLVLIPVEDESGEIVILEIEPVDEETENYLSVDDEAVLNFTAASQLILNMVSSRDLPHFLARYSMVRYFLKPAARATSAISSVTTQSRQ